MKLTIEILEKKNGAQEEVRDASLDVVRALLSSHQDDRSTTLILERAETDVLFLSMSSGRNAVTEQRGDYFYDLVGDPSAEGESEFVHGGQPAMHPNRHVVSLALAEHALVRFMGEADENSSALRWERQESSET
jgi:hypothetical protein